MTNKAQEAIRDALDAASRRGSPELYPEQILATIATQEGGVLAPLLRKAGADPNALVQTLNAKLESFPQVSGAEPALSRRTTALLERAADEAKASGAAVVVPAR